MLWVWTRGIKSLRKDKMLVSQNVFNPFPNKPWFLRVCSTSLLKTLWEKEKLLVTSNFSFSHSVFYLFGELSAIFNKLEIVVCKLLQFGRVQNFLFGKGLKAFPSTPYQTTKFDTSPVWEDLQRNLKTCAFFFFFIIIWLPAFPPFPTMFSKGFFPKVVKSRDCVVKI